MTAHPFDTLKKVGPLPDHIVINGEKRSSANSDRIAVVDPGSGHQIGEITAGTTDDINEAVASAKQALNGTWSQMMPRDRACLLWSVGDMIESRAEHLATVETLDVGKPLRESLNNVARTADYFRYYAGIVDKLEGTSIPLGPKKVCLTERIPVGVTGHIVPWNVPISMVTRGLAPALACGNTAVVKPAEDTSLTTLLLADILHEAGLPTGVVNIITGYGHDAGQALCDHPDIAHLTFTGSVETGKKVMTSAASHLASVTLELGGKSPHVILADADLDRAIPDAMKAIFTNAGQICSSGSRLIVERSIVDEVTTKLAERAAAMSLGHGMENPDMGPLVSHRQLQSVKGFVERAAGRGITFMAGGKVADVTAYEDGFYFEPTIAANVPSSDELAQSEIFGPVLCITTVDDFDEAISLANGTAYGLAAGIHTSDISKAMQFSRNVDAGQVFVNGYHSAGDTVPFGGMKDSGIGREKGLAALDSYCQTKATTISI